LVQAGAKKSETVFTGNEGEEKALDTFNFNFEGTLIKTVTHNTYDKDTLTLSTTNRVQNETADRALVETGAKKSETVFTGNEGEEKALDTFNFNFEGTLIKTVTHNTYDKDTLTLSTTNRVQNETADRALVETGAKKSETVFTGNEGEEKALDTFNFNFEGTLIKTV